MPANGAAPILPEVTSENLRGFLNVWWQSRDISALVPRKADIDPVALGGLGLLPSVWLMRRDGDDFVYVLCGEEIRKNYPESIKDRRVSEVFDADQARWILHVYRTVVDTPAAHYSEGPVDGSDSRLYFAQRLMLPLTDADGRMDYVIACVDKPLRVARPAVDTAPDFGITRRVVTPVDRIGSPGSRRATG